MISLLPELRANIAVGDLDWADLEGYFPHYEHTVGWTQIEYEVHGVVYVRRTAPCGLFLNLTVMRIDMAENTLSHLIKLLPTFCYGGAVRGIQWVNNVGEKQDVVKHISRFLILRPVTTTTHQKADIQHTKDFLNDSKQIDAIFMRKIVRMWTVVYNLYYSDRI